MYFPHPLWSGRCGTSSSTCHKRLQHFRLLPSCQDRRKESSALAGLPVLVGSLIPMPRMFPINCPGCSAGTEGQWGCCSQYCSLFPFCVRQGQSRSALGPEWIMAWLLCGQAGRTAPQPLPAHCCPVLGEQVSLFPGLSVRDVVVPNNKLILLPPDFGTK